MRSLNAKWPNWVEERWGPKAPLLASTIRPKVKNELNRFFRAYPKGFDTEEVQTYALKLRQDMSKSLKNRYDRLRYFCKGVNLIVEEVDSSFCYELIAELSKEMRPQTGQVRKTNRTYDYTRSDPLEEWSEIEQQLWHEVLKKDRLTLAKISHMVPELQRTHRLTYGQWVKYRNAQGLHYGDENLDFVEDFINQLHQRHITSVTKANIVRRIHTVMSDFEVLKEEMQNSNDMMDGFESYASDEIEIENDEDDGFDGFDQSEEGDAPCSSLDFMSWEGYEPTVLEYLHEQGLFLKRRAVPEKAKAPRIASVVELFDLGKSLCEKADHKLKSTQAAIEYRDGLMIMMLALRPVRLSNMMDLNILDKADPDIILQGTIDVETLETIWPSANVKNKSVLKQKLPNFIKPELHMYLQNYRPVLLGVNPTKQLWVTREGGRPMSGIEFEQKVKSLTLKYLNKEVPPHYFRDANAQFCVEGDLSWAVPKILHHRSEKSSETYKGQSEELKGREVQQGLMKEIAPQAVV